MKEKAAALQELKTKRVDAEEEEKHPRDVAFSKQAESVSRACEDLRQQVEIKDHLLMSVCKSSQQMRQVAAKDFA